MIFDLDKTKQKILYFSWRRFVTIKNIEKNVLQAEKAVSNEVYLKCSEQGKDTEINI